MAKVLGEIGRYASQQVAKKSRRIRLLAMLLMVVCGIALGYCLTGLITTKIFSQWLYIAGSVVVIVAIPILMKWGGKKWDELDRKREAMRRGLVGEHLVGEVLEQFPDDFYVINSLTTPFGDLDHIVVGPTGVFILDSKNWRGAVSSDGNGDLLLNGQATEKPTVRPFVSRMMKVKEQIDVLTRGIDVRFNAVLVFTAARVEAKWGTTGSANCVRDDQLHSYIVEKEFGKKLSADEAEKIAQAFLGLAHMDKEFPSSVGAKSL